MPIKKIVLKNIRSYDLFSAEFSPGITLILGKNGTGKTSLLEAIYYTSLGSSFRGRSRDMIAHGADRADILLENYDGSQRRAMISQTADQTTRRSFTIKDKNYQRLSPQNRQPVVLFEPEELRLISSSPERRRRFIDGMLSRLYPQYSTVLSRYQRTLLQRNSLLKRRSEIDQKSWENQLFTWDIKFAELAEQIVRMRREFIANSNTRLSPHYSAIAGQEHHISTSYQSETDKDNYKQQLINQLHSQKVADSYRGFTSVGPHRDDFVINIDDHPASEVASRGEMRTIMLAYKLLEIEMQTEIYDQPPLILMDDVFSELDSSRESKLMKALRDYQTIITATDLRDEMKIDVSIVRLD
ncbi:DNA recombination protein RecF [Candidatus Saccharibacteria bacterium]|nr:MAG: DNA recombination protein RecF [Candidatus Saccharibacteria bacterium]